LVPVIQAFSKTRAALVHRSVSKELKWIVVLNGADWRGNRIWFTLVHTFEVGTLITIPSVQALICRVAARNKRTISIHLVGILSIACADRRNFRLEAWVVIRTTAFLNASIVYHRVVIPVIKTLVHSVATRNARAVAKKLVWIFI